MIFKKCFIKSHYKANKLVRIGGIIFFKCNIKFQKTESRANKTFFA